MAAAPGSLCGIRGNGDTYTLCTTDWLLCKLSHSVTYGNYPLVIGRRPDARRGTRATAESAGQYIYHYDTIH